VVFACAAEPREAAGGEVVLPAGGGLQAQPAAPGRQGPRRLDHGRQGAVLTNECLLLMSTTTIRTTQDRFLASLDRQAVCHLHRVRLVLQVLSKAELQFLALLPELRPKVRVIVECGNWYVHPFLHLSI
jgi:hypothetical protein